MAVESFDVSFLFIHLLTAGTSYGRDLLTKLLKLRLQL